MNSEVTTIPPSVLWAQGSGHVFLTFNVQCEKPDIQIEKKTISFKGIGLPENKQYELDIPLYAEIDPDKSSHVNKSRCIEFTLAKESQDGSFWPSLTSDKKKHHWLKVDFNRWQDEETEKDSEDDYDQSDDLFKDKEYENCDLGEEFLDV